MDIHIGVGIGPVRFGMTEAEVEAAINEPECYEDWMGGNLNAHQFYHGLLFMFDDYRRRDRNDDPRLIEVTVHGRGDARLLGRAIEEWTKDGIVVALQQAGHEPLRLANGDVNVIGDGELLELSFDRDGVLTWVGLEGHGPR